MTAPTRPSWHYAIAAFSVVFFAPLAPSAAQIDAGLLATGRDREIATAYDTSSNRTDVTLTLVLPGRSGSAPQATMMFTAQFPGRTPAPGATHYFVRTHFTPRADPARRDPRTSVEGRDLIFELDPHTSSGIRLFLYASNYGYSGFVPPGDEVSLAFFTLTAAELRALAVPQAITGRALGSEFALDQGQLGAIREFVQRTVR